MLVVHAVARNTFRVCDGLLIPVDPYGSKSPAKPSSQPRAYCVGLGISLAFVEVAGVSTIFPGPWFEASTLAWQVAILQPPPGSARCPLPCAVGSSQVMFHCRDGCSYPSTIVV